MSARLIAPLVALALMFVARADAAPPGPADIPAIRAALAGTWQSLDDTRFSRELDADGRSADRYEGEPGDGIVGTWSVFLGASPPPGMSAQKLKPDVVYLRLQQNGDSLLFALAALSRSDMKMVYLERGNILSFTRLK